MRITIYSKSNESLRGRRSAMAPSRFRTETDEIGIKITATEAYAMESVKKKGVPAFGHRDLALSMTWADVKQFVGEVQAMVLEKSTQNLAVSGAEER